MQGTRLALLVAALLCAALVGCGGGGGESSSGTEAQTAPEGKPEAVAKLGEAAEQIRRERGEDEQGSSGEGVAKGSTGSGAEGSTEQGSSSREADAQPDPNPPNTHPDSGGGTEQFATKQGDNSIQESGSEADQGETEAAAAVLHAYLDARIAQRWDEACFYLSAGYAATIELFAERYAKGKDVKGCPEVLEAFASGAGSQVLSETAKADVGALRREGDRGFLLYHAAQGAPYAMPMAREGGAWKVGSLDGVPLG